MLGWGKVYMGKCKDSGLTNGLEKNIIGAVDRWICCPRCGNDKMLRVGPDTEARNMPVYCKRCRRYVKTNIAAAR